MKNFGFVKLFQLEQRYDLINARHVNRFDRYGPIQKVSEAVSSSDISIPYVLMEVKKSTIVLKPPNSKSAL